MATGFDFSQWGVSKVLIRNIIIGILCLLVYLLFDAKADTRRAEAARDRAEDLRQKSDQALAKNERECSDRLQELYGKLYNYRQVLDTLDKKVDGYEKLIKKRRQ